MSLLVNQPSKLCFPKPVFARSSPILSRRVNQPSQLCFGRPVFVSPTLSDGFSSSLLQTPPSMIIVYDTDGGKLVIRNLNETFFTYLERKVPLESVDDDANGKIGSSHGWVASLKDGRVLLHDDLNPIASDTDLKRISLPPLVTLPHCQTQIITNVSMSSPSPEEEDCVVAVKFLGPQISFCRPAAQKNSQWINIRLEDPCFFSSRVMFSKKDDMFRILGSGGHVIRSWDVGTQKQNPKLQRLRVPNFPSLTETKRRLLHSCFTSEHLVESQSTGEIFLIKWYRSHADCLTMNDIVAMKTEALMVFKLDDKRNAVYTQNIGGLCIYLSKSEPFCVPASSFPYLRSNSVEFLDHDEVGFVNLDTSSIEVLPFRFEAPYFIPPQKK